MSDSDELDLDEGESPGASTKTKKKGGLGALLPTILKFAAIGIGATIFIVTVVYFTISIMGPSGTTQTTFDPSSPYQGTLEELDWYSELDTIASKTQDNFGVSITIHIGYSKSDDKAASELRGRRYELRDFLRNYFARKYSDDFNPDNEERLKREIQEILNTRYLDTGKIRKITFDRLDVMEMN